MGIVYFPYLRFADINSSETVLVTPLGIIPLTLPVILSGLVTFLALIVSIILYRCIGTKRVSLMESYSGSKQSKSIPSDRSALQDNIIQKGQNSYYYAHKPRELNEIDNTEDDVKRMMISTYGWTDSKKTVKIYLTDDIISNSKPDQIVINWTSTSFSMDLLEDENGKLAKCLVIPTLFGDITNATWKVKSNQLTITFHKAIEGVEWKSLNGAAKKLEDHIEYDESLFD